MFDTIKQILTTRGGLPAHPIVPDATLAEAGVDSMAVTVLSMVLEERLGLVISEDELVTAPTVSALAELVSDRAPHIRP